jgi:hypothetical protein
MRTERCALKSAVCIHNLQRLCTEAKEILAIPLLLEIIGTGFREYSKIAFNWDNASSNDYGLCATYPPQNDAC